MAQLFKKQSLPSQAPKEFNMTKICMYSISCNCGKVYKVMTRHPLKVRLEEQWKAVCWGEIENSGIVDHIWKENGNYLPLWDEVKIIDWEEHWKIRCLKRSSYSDLLSRPSIEVDMIWEPIIEKVK